MANSWLEPVSRSGILLVLTQSWEESQGLAGQEERELREEEVGNQDRYGRDDDGLSCGPPDSLRAAAHRQSLVATDGRQQESKHDGLGHALHQVRKFQRVQSARPEFHGANAQGEIRNEETAG